MDEPYNGIFKSRVEETPSTRSRLGTKLRLLLNKSAQKENDDDSIDEDLLPNQQMPEQRKKRSSYFRTR